MDVLLERVKLGTKVQIRKKSVWLVTHGHEAGIQRGNQVLDASQIHVDHRKGDVSAFALEFHQLLVFKQCNGYLFGLYVYNEFACHNNWLLNDSIYYLNKEQTRETFCFTSLFFILSFRLKITFCFYVCSFLVFFYACA